MSWNYRVIKSVSRGCDFFAVHEVYYTDPSGGEDYDNVCAYSATPAEVSGETLDDLRGELKIIEAALSKPILDLDKLDSNLRHAKE